jgi:hypothetical protein
MANAILDARQEDGEEDSRRCCEEPTATHPPSQQARAEPGRSTTWSRPRAPPVEPVASQLPQEDD